jgi:hypothetical protein
VFIIVERAPDWNPVVEVVVGVELVPVVVPQNPRHAVMILDGLDAQILVLLQGYASSLHPP